jgi:hypothetical protein
MPYFERAAPYLKDPLVLIGFFLLLSISFLRLLIKRGVIGTLRGAHGYRILRLILICGFTIGLLLVIFGFALRYRELIDQQRSAVSIELKLREALDSATGLSEERKNEIIERVLEGYRNGAISKEQIEKKVEEIKNFSVPSANYPLMAGTTRNQLESYHISVQAKTTSPLLSPLNDEIQSQPEVNRVDEPETRTQNFTAASPGKEMNKETYRLPTDENRNTIPLLLFAPVVKPQNEDSSDEPKAGVCSVKITSPEEGSKVGSSVRVRGTGIIPAGGYLWILVRKKSLGDQWWPQGGGAVEIDETHRWEAEAFFGIPGDVGSTFEVAAVVVNRQTNEYLVKWFSTAKDLDYPPVSFPTPISFCSVISIKVVKTD